MQKFCETHSVALLKSVYKEITMQQNNAKRGSDENKYVAASEEILQHACKDVMS